MEVVLELLEVLNTKWQVVHNMYGIIIKVTRTKCRGDDCLQLLIISVECAA